MVSPRDLEGVNALAGVDARASAAGVDARVSAGADAVDADATVSAGAGLLGLGVVGSASASLGIGDCTGRNHGILGELLPTSCALSCATCPGGCPGAEAITMSPAGPPGEEATQAGGNSVAAAADGDAAPNTAPAVSSLLSSGEESVRDLRSCGEVRACRCLSRLRAAGLSTDKVSSGPLSQISKSERRPGGCGQISKSERRPGDQISKSERRPGGCGGEGATARAIDSS